MRDNDNTMLSDGVPSDLSKHIKRDNRIWLLAFLGVLIASGFAIWALGKQDAAIAKRHTAISATQRRTPYPGERQDRAADAIRARLAASGIKSAWVRFVDRDQVEVELPSTQDRAVASKVRDIVREVSMTYIEREPLVSVFSAASPGVGDRAELNLP